MAYQIPKPELKIFDESKCYSDLRIKEVMPDGYEMSAAAEGFLEYYSNFSEPQAYPGLAGSLFLLVVLIMILGTIWGPKNN